MGGRVITGFRVDLLCNDQQGTFERCVRRIKFGDVITLDAISLDRPPRLAYGEFGPLTRLVRISGRVFPVRGYTHCATMPQIDAVVMEPHVAVELLNFLKAKAAFEAEAGQSEAFELWRAEGGRFTAEELEAWNANERTD